MRKKFPALVAVLLLSALHCFLLHSCLLAEEDKRDANAEKVGALIRQLGAGDYKSRVAAETALRECSRDVLPILRKFQDANDPEVRERVRAVIKHIQIDPSHIPQSVFVFDAPADPNAMPSGASWNNALSTWHDKVTIAANHVKGNAGTSGAFSQSFIPHCKQIKAVELQTYPIGVNARGWLRLDVMEDENGMPGNYVLARSWLRIEKNCPARHSSFVVYGIPSVEVQPDKVYWLAFSEYVDADSPERYMTNYGLSLQNEFPEGKLLRQSPGSVSTPSENEDAKFRIISECGPAPMLHKATEKELENLPQPFKRELKGTTPNKPQE